MNFLEYALFLLFPTTCGICGKINSSSICEDCFEAIKMNASIDSYVNNAEKYFTEHAYLFTYDGVIRQKILQYKFYDQAYLKDMFCEFLIKNEKICRILKKYDIMIPVPISKKRLQQRGYNQSELIAKKICQKSNILFQNNLIKHKNNLPQSTLNKKERIQNVKDVYQLKNKETIQNKKILIFDDIYTTGSTTNECAKVLMKQRSITGRHFNNCKR